MADTPESRRPAHAEDVAAAVMGDPVTVAAIAHAGGEPVPGRAEAQKAEQSETSLRTESQRRINLIWEATQAVVTVMVVASTLFIAGSLILSENVENSDRATAFLLVSNAFFLIVTAYYQRTNHTRTGGVGGRNVETDR